MSPKGKQEIRSPSAEAKDKGVKALDEIMADLVVMDADSMDKAFVANAMLKFEELGGVLKDETDEGVVFLVNAVAKIFEELMMDEITVTGDTITLCSECAEFIKHFLEGSLDDSLVLEGVKGFAEKIKGVVKGEISLPASLTKAEPATDKPRETAQEGATPGKTAETPREGPSILTYPLPVNSEEDAVIYTEFISETLEHMDSIESGIMELEKEPGNMELLNAIFRHFHSVKGAAGFLGILDVGKISHETENLLDLARKGRVYVDKGVVNILLGSTDCQMRLLRRIDTRIQNILGHLPEDQIDPPYDIGPLLVQIRTVIEVPQGKPPPAAPEAARPVVDAAPSISKAHITSDIKVSTAKLDILMELVGELVISHALVIEDPVLKNKINANVLKNLSFMGKNTKSIQEQVMAVRMLPLKSVFQKMVRLVRDLSDKTNKKIRFEISGEDTEIDKTVIDQLNDPLVHLLRNSVDHGIESSDGRVAAGKSKTGYVALKAYNQGGNVVIEIIDDGKGLSRDRIRKKAVDKGLVKADQKLSDREIYDLILLPGFSTAARTTDISGRGVGMDVVCRNITKLNGKLEISSEEGKGSVFTVRLPLTMAIIDGMIVRVGKEKYIIPVASIRESIQPKKKDITTIIEGGEVVAVRGGLVPLIRLHKIFNVPATKKDPWSALVIIVENNGKKSGLMVDNLIGQQQVVIKNLGSRLQGVKGVSGAAILGDGKVGLILDVEDILEVS